MRNTDHNTRWIGALVGLLGVLTGCSAPHNLPSSSTSTALPPRHAQTIPTHTRATLKDSKPHIHIQPSGHTIHIHPPVANLHAEGCPTTGPHICRRNGAYDWHGLYLAALAIKAQHPNTHIASISASPDIPFEAIQKTADTLHALRVTERDTPLTARDDAAWTSSRLKPCPNPTAATCNALYPRANLFVAPPALPSHAKAAPVELVPLDEPDDAPTPHASPLNTPHNPLPDPDVPSDEPPFIMRIHVQASGHTVHVNDAIATPHAEGCPATGPHVCRRDGAYDWHGLYLAALTIKQRHPAQTVVEISAAPSVPFATIAQTIGTISAVRVASDDTTLNARDDAAWATSRPKPCPAYGDMHCDDLFPDAVINTAP